ncbi:MAG TPA: dienelactone hydrolase family protein [Candidatus Binatia bacterium]|nr:dienelactone hydrolase family protein [Candidatus Binatia bacterium]
MLLSRAPWLSILLLGLACALLSGCAASISGLSIPTTTATGAPEQIPARIFKPDGAGPFPAVVIMHDCSGVGPHSSGAPARWAGELVGRGYVAIVPDSFTTRGHAGGVCTDPSPTRVEVGPGPRVRDAYAALAYLRTLPYVEGSSVGIMGGSHGGATTLASIAAAENNKDLFAREKRAGFAAGVALYPGCAAPFGAWRVARDSSTGAVLQYTGVYKPVAPLLILVGESDDWTPAEPCQRLTDAAQRAGYPVRLKVYPGAHHSFDSDRPVVFVGARVNANSPTGRGATTGGNAEAWADSIREVAAFFSQYLAQGRK